MTLCTQHRGTSASKEAGVEHEAWMNEQVREEIADLKRRFGFDQ